MRRLLPLAVVSACCIALFLSVLAREEPSLQNPVFFPRLLPEPSRRDKVAPNAVVLQGLLAHDLRGGQTYRLLGTVTIPPYATVVISPGTTLVADHDSRVIVAGTLKVQRTSWSSNEQHPAKRSWHGILVTDGGNLTLEKSTIRHATAAVTCAEGSRASMTDSTATDSVAGVVTFPGSACDFARVSFVKSGVGALILGGTPRIRDGSFDVVGDGIRIFGDAQPELARLTMRRVASFAIDHRGARDIRMTTLIVRDQRSYPELIRDERPRDGSSRFIGRVILEP